MTSFTWAAWAGANKNCYGGPRPGTVALLAYLLESFSSSWNGGVYACRLIAGTNNSSVHGDGRAIDLMLPLIDGKANPLGHHIVKLLGEHAAALGIQAVIFDRKIWSRTSPGGRAYTGVHPHYDHLHIEMTSAKANSLTLTQIRNILKGTTTPAPPTSKEELPVQVIKDIQDNLNKAGFNAGTVDGVWGPKTKAAHLRMTQAAAKVSTSGGGGGTGSQPVAKTKTYTVKRGDTMRAIAAAHKITLAALSKLNPSIKNLDAISVGQKINVPA